MTSPNDRVAVIRYIQVIVFHKRFIALVTGSAMLLSVAVALLLPKKYEARSLLMPPQMDQASLASMVGQMSGVGAVHDLLGGSSVSEVYASILKSDGVRNRIIDRFNYLKEYETRVDARKKLDKVIRIDTGKKDGIVAVTAEDEDPKRSADLVNASVDELNALVMSMNVEQAGENRRFLEGRITMVKNDMTRLENEIKNFRSRNKTVDIIEQAKATIGGIAELKSRLAAEETKLAALRTSRTDGNPEVLTCLASVATLRSQIASLEGAGGKGGVPSLGAVPEIGEEYLRLQRNLKIQEVLLESLTKQYELARLTENRTVPSVVVIQRAEIPDKKSSPKRTLIVLMSTFVAFIFSIAAAFVREIVSRLPEEERAEWLGVWRSLALWRAGRQS